MMLVGDYICTSKIARIIESLTVSVSDGCSFHSYEKMLFHATKDLSKDRKSPLIGYVYHWDLGHIGLPESHVLMSDQHDIRNRFHNNCYVYGSGCSRNKTIDNSIENQDISSVC